MINQNKVETNLYEENKYLKALGREKNYSYWKNKILFCLSEFCLSERKKIIELGAGYGNLVLPLWEDGFDIEAVDLNYDGLQYILEHTNNEVPVHHLDLTKDKLPTENALYILRSCLMNVISQDDRHYVYKNLHKFMHKKAALLIEIFDPGMVKNEVSFENKYQKVQFFQINNRRYQIQTYHKNANKERNTLFDLLECSECDAMLNEIGLKWKASFKATGTTISRLYHK